MEDLIFPCHTSIMSHELLLQKLAEEGVEISLDSQDS